jgi:hypothetical protein
MDSSHEQYHHNNHKGETMTETITKPRWVECADKASNVLDAARDAKNDEKDAIVREADAWMRLGYLYRDGHLNAPESDG